MPLGFPLGAQAPVYQFVTRKGVTGKGQEEAQSLLGGLMLLKYPIPWERGSIRVSEFQLVTPYYLATLSDAEIQACDLLINTTHNNKTKLKKRFRVTNIH